MCNLGPRKEQNVPFQTYKFFIVHFYPNQMKLKLIHTDNGCSGFFPAFRLCDAWLLLAMDKSNTPHGLWIVDCKRQMICRWNISFVDYLNHITFDFVNGASVSRTDNECILCYQWNKHEIHQNMCPNYYIKSMVAYIVDLFISVHLTVSTETKGCEQVASSESLGLATGSKWEIKMRWAHDIVLDWQTKNASHLVGLRTGWFSQRYICIESHLCVCGMTLKSNNREVDKI